MERYSRRQEIRESKSIQNLTDKTRTIHNKIDWLHWASSVIATKSLVLAAQGIDFIEHLIAPPATENRRHSQLSRR